MTMITRTAEALAVVVGASLLVTGCVPNDNNSDAASDHENAEYVIDGRRIKLTDGVSEIEAAPGSASKILTRYFGNETRHDLNGDGREDVVFLLTHETGGSGVFYYAVAALDTEQGYVGSEGVLLGDRIAPQAIEIGPNDIVIVSYADRAPGESFATPPSQDKSIWLLLDAETLQFGEVEQNFEGEADPATMKLDMKTWVWVSTRYKDGREIVPRQADAFTLTFGADGRFSATTDCNRAGGTYAAVADRLTFSDLFATRMYCEGAQEREFAAMLTDATGYRFTSRGQLIVELESGIGSAEFR